MTTNPVAPRPQEQLPIPLFDGVVLAVRADDGQIFLGLRDMCQTLGLDPSSQRRRIRSDDALHLVDFRVLVERQFRTLDFLLLEDVPVWLLSVQPRRVAPEIRERFTYIKTYLVTAVQQAFGQLTGLSTPSNAIEDLHELDRVEQAFGQLTAIAQRQTTLETSQERARAAFRDLTTLIRELQARVHTLEQHQRGRLSATQRGTIYQLVQQWGSARASAAQPTQQGPLIRKSWAELNARFGVSTYVDLPAARYEEILQFLQQQYYAVSGHELAVVEQRSMNDIEDADAE